MFAKNLLFFFFILQFFFWAQSSFWSGLKMLLPIDFISWLILYVQILTPFLFKIVFTLLSVIFLESQSLSPAYFYVLLYFLSLSFILWFCPKLIRISFRSFVIIGGSFFVFKFFLMLFALSKMNVNFWTPKYIFFFSMFLILNTLWFPVGVFFFEQLYTFFCRFFRGFKLMRDEHHEI